MILKQSGGLATHFIFLGGGCGVGTILCPSIPLQAFATNWIRFYLQKLKLFLSSPFCWYWSWYFLAGIAILFRYHLLSMNAYHYNQCFCALIVSLHALYVTLFVYFFASWVRFDHIASFTFTSLYTSLKFYFWYLSTSQYTCSSWYTSLHLGLDLITLHHLHLHHCIPL